MLADTMKSTAIVTASYAPDFERCRLLCESIDRHVSGYSCHYILVETADVAMFRKLESARRKVINERDLLPFWLRAFPDPLSLGKRRIWLSPFALPMRGWHTQQLRRIAIAAQGSEDAYFYCDSDVVFIRDFEVTSLWKGSDLRLFRREHALRPEATDADHLAWLDNAAWLIGALPEKVLDHDYIGTLIAWRGDTVRAMIKRIETVHGRHWVAAIGKRRRFSECTIYGQFADGMAGGAGHIIDNQELCEMFWLRPMPTETAFLERVATMDSAKVAIGIQSFIGTDTDEVRRLVARIKA